MSTQKNEWQLYEVFIRSKKGLSHQHAGGLHAPNDKMAIQYARDLYTRRNEGESIWVVRSNLIAASNPQEKDALFSSAKDKIYRHPSFYEIPEEVEGL